MRQTSEKTNKIVVNMNIIIYMHSPKTSATGYDTMQFLLGYKVDSPILVR